MKPILLSAALAALRPGARPASADGLGAGGRVAGASALDGRGRDRPRVPGGSGGDVPVDRRGHPERRAGVRGPSGG